MYACSIVIVIWELMDFELHVCFSCYCLFSIEPAITNHCVLLTMLTKRTTQLIAQLIE